jgi:hypothetical protein
VAHRDAAVLNGNQSQVVAGRGQARVEIQSPGKDHRGLVVPAWLLQDLALSSMTGGDLGPPFDDPFDPTKGLELPPPPAEHDAKQVQGVGLVGLDGEQGPKTVLRRVQPSGAMVGDLLVEQAAHQDPPRGPRTKTLHPKGLLPDFDVTGQRSLVFPFGTR